MYILGINAYHGDAAAAIIRDGQLIAAVEEERFNRCKHCAGFPTESVKYCLAAAGDYPSAVRLYSAARKEARGTGLNWPNHPQTLAMLRRAEQALGPAELEQAWRDGETLTIQNLAEFVVPSTTSG